MYRTETLGHKGSSGLRNRGIGWALSEERLDAASEERRGKEEKLISVLQWRREESGLARGRLLELVLRQAELTSSQSGSIWGSTSNRASVAAASLRLWLTGAMGRSRGSARRSTRVGRGPDYLQSPVLSCM